MTLSPKKQNKLKVLQKPKTPYKLDMTWLGVVQRANDPLP